MKNIFSGSGLLIAAMIFAGCAAIFKGTVQDESFPPTVPPGDDKAVQGNWKPVKAELAGHPMTDAVLKIISLKLDNGNYEVFVGDEPDRGTYTIDGTTTPKSMTITGTAGPNNGKTFPAIYELHDDTLRICYDLSGAKTPAEFKSTAGTQLYLVNYIRKKE